MDSCWKITIGQIIVSHLSFATIKDFLSRSNVYGDCKKS